MLYFKNNKFHTGGISYALPQDVYVITDLSNLSDTLAFKSEDQKISVTINTVNTELGGTFNLREFEEKNLKVKEIAPFGYANVSGESAIYTSESNEYYEIRLSLPEPSDTEKGLIISVTVQKGDLTIEEAVKSSVISGLLLSIKKEL